MTVWVLVDRCYDTIEGIYTPAGKEVRDNQLFETANEARVKFEAKCTLDMSELREVRQPYIIEANELLEKEQEAKLKGDTKALKNIRKQRKTVLKQAERLTYDIKRLEERLLASQRMTKSAILNQFSYKYYWEEYDLIGDLASKEFKRLVAEL